MSSIITRIRSNIYWLEITTLFVLSLLWIIWGILDGRSILYIVKLVLLTYFILWCAWGFYLLMIYFWRSTPLWLLIVLAVLSAGAAIGGYLFLAVFDLFRLMLYRTLYHGDAPVEYFWDKNSSENLKAWKRDQKAAGNLAAS